MSTAGSRVAIAAAIGAAALFVAGCGGGGDNGGGSGKNKDVTIGFSQRRIAGSDWYKTLIQGAKD